MTRGWCMHLAAAAVVTGFVLAGPGAVSRGWAEGGGVCDRYNATSSAVGLSSRESAPGVLITDADASLPAAQARVDSLVGSSAWAGAPYSSAAAENVGLAGFTANEIPVFATSAYPTTPKTRKSTAASTLEAESGPRFSRAHADAGSPTAGLISGGRTTASAAASCADDGTLTATSSNSADLISIAQILTVGRVSSHAKVSVDPFGRQTLVGTVVIAGVEVVGQKVAIGSGGLVVAGSTVPTPGNPAVQALKENGISIRYLAADKDPKTGTVIAPGLEITVRHPVPGVGSGEGTTTYTFGRAIAMGRLQAAGSSPATDSGPPPPPPSGLGPPGPPYAGPVAHPPMAGQQLTGGTSSAVPDPAMPSIPASPRALGAVDANSIVANVGPYPAVAIAALLLLGAWVFFGHWGVRIQWR